MSLNLIFDFRFKSWLHATVAALSSHPSQYHHLPWVEGLTMAAAERASSVCWSSRNPVIARMRDASARILLSEFRYFEKRYCQIWRLKEISEIPPWVCCFLFRWILGLTFDWQGEGHQLPESAFAGITISLSTPVISLPPTAFCSF